VFLYSVTVTTTAPLILDAVELHLSVYVKAEDRLRFCQNAWLVCTPNWPNWLRNAVAHALTPDDQLLITAIAQPFDGIFDSRLVSWINSRLVPYAFEAYEATSLADPLFQPH
jgi:hypothetical protein